MVICWMFPPKNHGIWSVSLNDRHDFDELGGGFDVETHMNLTGFIDAPILAVKRLNMCVQRHTHTDKDTYSMNMFDEVCRTHTHTKHINTHHLPKKQA